MLQKKVFHDYLNEEIPLYFLKSDQTTTGMYNFQKEQLLHQPYRAERIHILASTWIAVLKRYLLLSGNLQNRMFISVQKFSKSASGVPVILCTRFLQV